MKRKRCRYGAEFKTKVVLAALKGDRTINELATEFEVHPNQIVTWKKKALEELPGIFSSRSDQDKKAEDELRARLYEEIGRLKVEIDWLKKKTGVER